MENLDGTIITPALPLMARSFGISATTLSTVSFGHWSPNSGNRRDTFLAQLGIESLLSNLAATISD